MKHFLRKSANICKSIVWIDADQLYPYSMCQPMLTVFLRVGISIQKREASHLDKTRPTASKTWSCEIERFFTIGRRKKIDYFRADGFCFHCNNLFEAKGCFYHFCPYQELRPSLIEEDIQRGSKKRELDALRRHYIQEKSLKVIEMWECDWWRLYKTTNTVKLHIRQHFLYMRSVAAEQLLEEIKEGK